MIGISCVEAPGDTTTATSTVTQEPEDTSTAALEGWLAASIVIIILLISLCVAFAIVSAFLYCKCQKGNDVVPAASTATDSQEVKVDA